ncbi:MAG: copper resistance protein CopC [Yoonia sp.]|nr:copper resistance protein CopC [Yoonia sp.]
MKQILLAGLLGIWATGAVAHSPLESTTPLHEAIVAQVPENVLLDFKGAIRLTRVTMTHADHDGVDLDLSGHKGFITNYAIPLEAMGGGTYSITWRGLGIDGHALDGTFTFVVE